MNKKKWRDAGCYFVYTPSCEIRESIGTPPPPSPALPIFFVIFGVFFHLDDGENEKRWSGAQDDGEAALSSRHGEKQLHEEHAQLNKGKQK